MSKKIISIILAILLIGATTVVGVSAEDGEEIIGEYYLPTPYVASEEAQAVGFNRYFFLMPDNWSNEWTSSAGMYWWDGTDPCGSLDGAQAGVKWPGYQIYKYGDSKANVWYCDVPKDVTTIIFNNALDGGDPSWSNFEETRYTKAYQTVDIGSEYYDAGESENYPSGTDSFNNMIYVVDPDKTNVSVTGKETYAGEWYFYHGDGKYDTELNPTYGGAEGDAPHPSTDPTTEPTTAEPATEVPTTAEEPTTAAPLKTFKVTATSNFADPVSKVYSEADKQIVVTYNLKSDIPLMNGDWEFTYDNTILRFNKEKTTEMGFESVMPLIDNMAGSSMTNVFGDEAEPYGKAYGNFSNATRLYNFSKYELEECPLFQATFDIVGDYTKDTVVNLDMKDMTGAVLDSSAATGRIQYPYFTHFSEEAAYAEHCRSLTTLSEAAPVPTAVPTTEATTAEPTTVEPTTAEPTTAEPTTVAPTTAEPTTEAPTTAPVLKKYTVAGDAGLTGVMWDPASNEMTEGSYEFDGNTYDFAITFEDVPAGAYGFKVTNGTWDEAYPAGNFTFSTGDTGYVKVYFNSETKEIAVDPQYPKTWELESIIAVGNGDGTWLNGANWDLTDTSNLLTEVEPGIWEITYEDIEAYDGYEVKFACNQSWQPYNWTIDGVLDGQTNTPIAVPFDNATVTLRIDVNSFDFATGAGSVQTAVIIKNSKGHVLGDVDGDGEATIKDASAIQMYLAKLAEDGDTFDAQVADFNADGKVNIFDVAAIQMSLAGRK